MFASLLVRLGLKTLKSQVITGVSIALVIVVTFTVIHVIDGWKQDIIDTAHSKTTIATKDAKIKILEVGKNVDQQIIDSSDIELCIMLGGCLYEEPPEDGPVQRGPSL